MQKILLISISEAARQLGIAEKTARNWISSDRFPVLTVRLGSRRMVRVIDLQEFVDGLGADRPPMVSDPISENREVRKKTRGRPRKIATVIR